MGKHATTIYLEPELHRQARIYAIAKGRSLTDVIEELLRRLLESHEPPSRQGAAPRSAPDAPTPRKGSKHVDRNRNG